MKSSLQLFAIFLAISILSSCGGSKVIDNDGNRYNTVKIGEQVWMAENLNVSTYSNGDIILEANSRDQWIKYGEEKKGCWCYFENKEENGNKYGKLYNWYAVNDKRGLAPQGWHIPTYAEWTTLTDYLGGANVAGDKLKAKKSWDSPKDGATNSSGFTALPGGQLYHLGTFLGIGTQAYWWSSTEKVTKGALVPSLYTDNSRIGFGMEYSSAFAVSLSKDDSYIDYYVYGKHYGFSIRCIKN